MKATNANNEGLAKIFLDAFKHRLSHVAELLAALQPLSRGAWTTFAACCSTRTFWVYMSEAPSGALFAINAGEGMITYLWECLDSLEPINIKVVDEMVASIDGCVQADNQPNNYAFQSLMEALLCLRETDINNAVGAAASLMELRYWLLSCKYKPFYVHRDITEEIRIQHLMLSDASYVYELVFQAKVIEYLSQRKDINKTDRDRLRAMCRETG
jgi:hypothetical protein